MKINIYIIDKKNKNDLYAPLVEHYIKICRPFAEVTVHEIFTKEIAKAQDASPDLARRSYTQALEKYLTQCHAIVLDPNSKEVDSHSFANLLKDRGVINLFIGGAHGFEREFIRQSNNAVSFGKITLSHKLIKVVLLEQLFRGLSIINNHPYHK